LVTWSTRAFVGLIALMGLWTVPASAQSGENVLVVVNRSNSVSEEIGDYYAQKRAISADQVLRIEVPITEEISRTVYETQIERPIAKWLTTHSAQDRILYLVLTKGVPLRIAGTDGPTGTVASVDSELTLLYRQLASGGPNNLAGPMKNPYFASTAPLSQASAFDHRGQDIYLVARLDGYKVDDVKALIDRGGAPSQQGIVVLDGRVESAQSSGNAWLVKAASALTTLPDWSERVVLDTSARVLRDQQNVLGYYSWGSNDVVRRPRHLQNQFAPGALAAEFVSTDARTFQEPPANWETNTVPFRGSHQSLIADLVRDGITGVAGHVAEPYVNGTIRPDILFPAYAAGFNLIESFYLAMPSVSWRTLVVGDPLCAPFRTKSVAAGDLDPAIDPSTEMPQFLSDRRVRALTAAGAKLTAARLVAKSEVLVARDEQPRAREALEQATVIDDGFLAAHLSLASLYESLAEWDLAIDRYHQVLAKKPLNAVALNNLAYILATQKNRATEALSLAKQAVKLSNAAPGVTDTLAWVYHLLGQDAEAQPLITAMAKRLPDNPLVRLHAAAILAATGNADAATRELDAALRLDPKLAEHADVQELRVRLPASK